MNWFIKLEVDGADAYPQLRQAMQDPAIYAKDKVRFELMKLFGYFISESSEHNAEYNCYFMHRDDQIAAYDVPVDEYVRRSVRNLKRYEETRRKLLAGRVVPDRAQRRVRLPDHPRQGYRPAAGDLRKRAQRRPGRQPAARCLRRGAGGRRSQRAVALSHRQPADRARGLLRAAHLFASAGRARRARGRSQPRLSRRSTRPPRPRACCRSTRIRTWSTTWSPPTVRRCRRGSGRRRAAVGRAVDQDAQGRVDRGALPRQQERGRVHLLDDGRSGDAIAGRSRSRS
jgi:hypothetical protein